MFFLAPAPATAVACTIVSQQHHGIDLARTVAEATRRLAVNAELVVPALSRTVHVRYSTSACTSRTDTQESQTASSHHPRRVHGGSQGVDDSTVHTHIHTHRQTDTQFRRYANAAHHPRDQAHAREASPVRCTTPVTTPVRCSDHTPTPPRRLLGAPPALLTSLKDESRHRGANQGET